MEGVEEWQEMERERKSECKREQGSERTKERAKLEGGRGKTGKPGTRVGQNTERSREKSREEKCGTE